MARVSNWQPAKFDGEFLNASMDRLEKAANLIADRARSNCPVGTITRPIYKTGPYAGVEWTKRDAGALKKSIRVVKKHNQDSAPIAEGRNIRVYAGSWMVYYAKIVEYAGKKFLRPALNSSKNEVRGILQNG